MCGAGGHAAGPGECVSWFQRGCRSDWCPARFLDDAAVAQWELSPASLSPAPGAAAAAGVPQDWTEFCSARPRAGWRIQVSWLTPLSGTGPQVALQVASDWDSEPHCHGQAASRSATAKTLAIPASIFSLDYQRVDNDHLCVCPPLPPFCKASPVNRVKHPSPQKIRGERMLQDQSKLFFLAEGVGVRTFFPEPRTGPAVGWPALPPPLSFGCLVRPFGEGGRATRKLYSRFTASDWRLKFCVSRFIAASDFCDHPRVIDRVRIPPPRPLPRCAGPTQHGFAVYGALRMFPARP